MRLLFFFFINSVPKPFAGEVDEDDKKSQEEHQVVCVDLILVGFQNLKDGVVHDV